MRCVCYMKGDKHLICVTSSLSCRRYSSSCDSDWWPCWKSCAWASISESIWREHSGSHSRSGRHFRSEELMQTHCHHNVRLLLGLDGVNLKHREVVLCWCFYYTAERNKKPGKGPEAQLAPKNCMTPKGATQPNYTIDKLFSVITMLLQCYWPSLR